MREVDKKEYTEAFKGQELKVISSFSDPDGTHFYGFGFPVMHTDYSTEGNTKPVARCESHKPNPQTKEWVHTYYLSKPLG